LEFLFPFYFGFFFFSFFPQLSTKQDSIDYLGLVEDMLMERHGTWWKVSMGHMTRYWRHVTKRKGNIESWNFMEGHGNFRKKEMYIFTT